MRESEVYMLYEMNKESNIVIKIPVEITNSITVYDMVNQGTISLCCVATEKIWGININTHHHRAYYRSTSVRR